MGLSEKLKELPGLKDLPGMDKLGNLGSLGKINEVVGGVPNLVVKAVALHALVLRGEPLESALAQLAACKTAMQDAAKD